MRGGGEGESRGRERCLMVVPLSVYGEYVVDPPCACVFCVVIGKLGIGGLTSEFNQIFRRAFASRVFPGHIVKQLGINHVRQITYMITLYIDALMYV
jgi:hypothetical protein